MPFLRDEELLVLHNNIDNSKTKADEWQEKHQKISTENTGLKRAKKGYLIALIALGIIFLFLLYTARVKPFLLTNNKTLEKSGYQLIQLDTTRTETEKLIDSTSYTAPRSIENYDGVIYQVQIGAFKKFDMAIHSKDFSHFNEYTNGFNKYALGKFSTYSDATTFKNNLKKIGFKEVFLISFYEKEQIDIKEALELSNELEFLE